MPCLQSELPILLEASKPHDPELVDLIERPFLEEQIDGQKTDFAFQWLWMHECGSKIAQVSAYHRSAFVVRNFCGMFCGGRKDKKTIINYRSITYKA